MNTSNKTKTTRKIRKKVARVRKPLLRRRRTNQPPMRGRTLAAASSKQFKKRFKVLRQNGSSVRVTGRDLIYSIPDDNTAPIQTSNVIAVIPANPVYWRGSRIAALASGYQNYRPLKFKITYVPAVAATQQGNVIGGTIWDNGFEADNIQQSLRTSNGGFLTQCYIPHTTTIRPKTNLQFNLYRVGGAFDQQSNPFVFIAIALGCRNSNNQRIIPGYFYVTWSFELKNPIGANGIFTNTGLTTYSTIQPALNTTIVNVDPQSDVPFGAFIDVEYENRALVPKYNNTPVEIEQNTPVWVFQSKGTNDQMRAMNKNIIYYDFLTTEHIFQLPTDKNVAIIYSENAEYYTIRVPTTDAAQGKYVSLGSKVEIYYTGSQQQVFGIYDSTTDATYWSTSTGGTSTQIPTFIYHAPKSQFDIQMTINNRINQNTKKVNNIRIKPNSNNKINVNMFKLFDDDEAEFENSIQQDNHINNNIILNENELQQKQKPPDNIKERSQSNKPKIINEEEEQKEENHIIEQYLQENDIHNDKDLHELENKLKQFKLNKNNI